MTKKSDVLIIGGGPSGLSAATELRTRYGAQVTVLERESEAGGIPRHSDHPGYGMRDLQTFTTGPRYARRLVDRAVAAGVDIQTGVTVTEWNQSDGATCVSASGINRIHGSATLLATGARERPRSARMIPGDRPAGVYTTGELQNSVHLFHQSVGKRAVVVGGQLVSWSAVYTLREAGCKTVAMLTEHSHAESYRVFNLGGKILLRTPVHTNTRVVRVIGRGRVSGIEVENTKTGIRSVIECDTVIFTGDWIPDHELARSAGLELDRGTRGPLVDALGRTSAHGVFAAGNSVHPVDTADVAALGGKHTAAAIAAFLEGQSHVTEQVRILGDAPFTWVSPGWFSPGVAPSRGMILAWVEQEIPLPVTITARQNGVVIGRKRVAWPASPGRVFRMPWSLLEKARIEAGPVTLSI